MSDGFGQLGRSLEDLKRSSFFQWFSLEPVDDEAAFRPEGPAFRDSVLLRATSADGRLTSLALTLTRDFIDTSRTKPFAADIVKSFVGAVVDSSVPLTQTLEHEMMSFDPVTDPAALTLRGLAQSYTENVGEFSISMENTPDDEFVVRIEKLP